MEIKIIQVKMDHHYSYKKRNW